MLALGVPALEEEVAGLSGLGISLRGETKDGAVGLGADECCGDDLREAIGLA